VARNLLLSIVLIHFLSGCSNLMTADPPDHVLTGIHDFGTTALAYTADGPHFISGVSVGRSGYGMPPSGNRAVRAILPLTSGGQVSGGDEAA